MAGLSDTLNAVRGMDPADEQAARKKKAAQFEQSYGSSAPDEEEAGLHEETGPADVIRPYKEAALQNTGLTEEHPLIASAIDMALPDSPLPFLGQQAGKAMKLASKEGQLARMAERGAPSSANAAASKVSPGLWQDATRDSNKLKTVLEDPNAAQEAYNYEQKASRAGAQKLKDIESGVKRPGGAISPSPDQDYAFNNAPANQAKSAVPTAASIGYNQAAPGSIKDLQEQMATAQASGTAEGFKQAKSLLQQIRDKRQGINVTPRGGS